MTNLEPAVFYRCVDKSYDSAPRNRYESVQGFRDMVLRCFGFRIDLRQNRDGNYEERGKLILVRSNYVEPKPEEAESIEEQSSNMKKSKKSKF